MYISTEEKEITCFIIIVDDGSAARLPLAPAAKSKAASPHALPTQSENRNFNIPAMGVEILS